jgi:RND superfamily putative drug exporter
MGVILAVAVLLDATLIRLLLQPVVLRALGERAWWIPAWLDRLVPNVGVSHGPPTSPSGAGSVAKANGVPLARPDGSA